MSGKKIIPFLFCILSFSVSLFSQNSLEEIPYFLNSELNSSSLRYNPSTLALDKDLRLNLSVTHSAARDQFTSIDFLGSFSNFGASVYYNKIRTGVNIGLGYGNFFNKRLRAGVYSVITYKEHIGISGFKSKGFDFFQSIGIAYDFSRRFSASIVHSQLLVSGDNFSLNTTYPPLIGMKYNFPKMDYMTLYLDFYEYKPKLGLEFEVIKNLKITGFGSYSVYGLGINYKFDGFEFGGIRNQKMSDDTYSSMALNASYAR